MRRNQIWDIDPANPRKRIRYPAPQGRNTDAEVPQDGFERLSTADPRTGIRQPMGGTPVFPPYHEDQS